MATPEARRESARRPQTTPGSEEPRRSGTPGEEEFET